MSSEKSSPHLPDRQTPPPPGRTPEEELRREDARSLDLVQRIVISALIIVVMGSFSAGLAAYNAAYQNDVSRGGAIVLWLMTGVIGLVTAVVVLMVNRRHPYSPWVLLGLLPMAASAPWMFG